MFSDSEILGKQNSININPSFRISTHSDVLLKANNVWKATLLTGKNIIQIMTIVLCSKELINLANIL